MKTDIDRHFKDKGMLMFVDQQVPDMMSIASSFYAMGGMVQGIDPQHFTNDFLRDADADAIVVRSATRVDEALLAGTKVQFVGSTTAGADHLDRAWMEHYGIKCAHCPGANAAAVADYVLSAMARLRPSWRAGPVGIVGCGHIGSLLARRLMRLGTPILCHDPLVERIENVGRLRTDGLPMAPLRQVLQCPVVSLHCSLVRHGPNPSHHLLDGERLALLPEGGLLINSARGDCIDGAALLQRPDLALALDVWPGEPHPDPALVAAARLATPHIAGYSQRSTRAIVNGLALAICDHFRLPEPWSQRKLAPPRPVQMADGGDLNAVLAASFPWDAAQILDPARYGAGRHQLRKRLEFADWRAPKGHPLEADLLALGFDASP